MLSCAVEQNRRVIPRKQGYYATVQCVDGGRVDTVRVIDINSLGMQFTKRKGRLAVDAQVKLFVPVPNFNRNRSKLCLFEGRVAWVSGERIGIRFMDPDAHQRRMLEAYVD